MSRPLDGPGESSGASADVVPGVDVARPVLIPVSAVFADAAAVARAVRRLTAAGVPRDLIEVVVSPAAARRFYPGTPTAGTRQTVRYAGIGGLLGLAAGVVVALVVVALPGWIAPGATALAQLLGPNALTLVGAAAGAVVGFTRRRPPEPRHARAAAAPDGVVVVVRTPRRDDVPAVAQLLKSNGGRDPRAENDSATARSTTPPHLRRRRRPVGD